MYDTLRQVFAEDLATKCSKGTCSLDLRGMDAPLIILDCDRHHARCGKTEKICDYAVFVCSSSLRAIVVEMKGGKNVAARTAVDQVQAGATMIETTSHITNVAVDLYPLVLHSGVKHANEYKVLASGRVVFRGRKYGIVLKRCGSRLRDILRSLT